MRPNEAHTGRDQWFLNILARAVTMCPMRMSEKMNLDGEVLYFFAKRLIMQALQIDARRDT
jgi:hypothetical protein